METIYADGVANVTLIDGVVRLNLVSLSQVEKEQQKAQVQPVATLAVSLPGLLRVHEQVGKVIDELLKQGVLTKKEGVATATTTEATKLN